MNRILAHLRRTVATRVSSLRKLHNKRRPNTSRVVDYGGLNSTVTFNRFFVAVIVPILLEEIFKAACQPMNVVDITR